MLHFWVSTFIDRPLPQWPQVVLGTEVPDGLRAVNTAWLAHIIVECVLQEEAYVFL